MNNKSKECFSKRALDEQTTRFLDSILEHDDRPTYLCNRKREIVYYNSAFKDFYSINRKHQHCYSLVFNRDNYCPWCPIDSELTIPNKNARNITIYNNYDNNWLELSSSELELNKRMYHLLRIKNITSIKKLEDEHKFHYEQYKNIFHENLYACAYHKIILDDDNKPVDYEFIEVNQKFAEFTNLKISDVVGKKVTEIFPKIRQSHVDWINIYGKVALTGEPVQMQGYFEELDKWFKIACFRTFESYFIVIFEDITETMAFIENLKLSSESLEQSTVATIWADEAANIVKANKAAYKLLRCKRNRFSKLLFTEIGFNIDPEKYQEILKKLKKENILKLDVIYKRGNGTSIDLHIMAKYFTFNQKSYLVFSLFDFTDQKKIEKQLKQTNIEVKKKLEETSTLFQHILDNTTAAITIMDRKGKMLIANKTVADLSNASIEELTGANIYDYLEGETLATLKQSVDRIIQTKKPFLEEITYYSLFDKGDRTFISSKFPLLDDNNNVYAVGLISTDITDIKLTQQHLELAQSELFKSNMDLVEAHKHKDKFLSNISHELRTPLNAIIGFTDLLFHTYNDKFDKTQKEYLNLIKESSSHLLALINDILDLSRITSGKIELDITDFNFIDFMNSLSSLLYPQIEEKNIVFESDIEPNLQRIHADNRKLKQILLNLLSNAIKYTPEGGKIIIRARKQSQEVLINIIDNGYGIAKDEQDKVFSEFFKSSTAEKYAVGGTGIGLVLTKKLVELHGGTIGFESQLNEGSNFWFTIPLNY